MINFAAGFAPFTAEFGKSEYRAGIFGRVILGKSILGIEYEPIIVIK
jgi:hypothetical protein